MKRKTASSSSAISFLSQSGDSLGLSSSLLWSGSLLKDFVDEYANLPGEINTALKKSMKKEPTTKLKGLAELSQLLETQPEDVILSFLEVWTRTYPKLSLDADKRVRQAVHSGPFLTLVRKAGRNLAPSLKKLIGQWISSQMDPISDVSEAAKSCFNEAIPASKHLQSLMFCKKEILQFIEDQIQQTPQILGETYRDLSKIQLQDLYERVVSSAISSLSLLINSFTEETNLELLPRYNEILGANFWKLDQKAPLIRKAKYLLVAALSNKCKVYIEQNLNQNVTNFIKFLDESDPNCFLALLDGLLCFFKQVPEAWRVAGAQKNFQSKIGARLRDAFHGNVASYSSLLPLMSVFPSTLIEDTKFFESFFQAMWAGLTSDNCLSSDALVSSFFEIIQYLTRQSNNSISANSAHQISPSAAPLIKDYLLGRALMFPLGQIFRFKFSDLDSASFFRSLSAFLVSLTNQTYASSAEDCNQCLERLSTFVEDVISRAEEVPSEAPAPAAEPVEGETESPTEKLINRLSLMITTIGSSVGEKEKDFTPFFQNIWKMLFEKAINSSETHFDLLSKIAKQMSFSPFLAEEQITRVLDDDFSSKLLRPPTNDAEFVRNWSRIACSCLSGAPQSVWDRFVSQVVSKLTRPVSLVFFQEVGQFSSSSGWASPEIDQYVLALLKQLQSDFSSKPKSARLCYRIIRLILSGIKIQNQTKELVAEKSSEFVDAFMAEDCSEQGFSIALIQQIVFLSYLLHTSLKSISSSSSSSSSSSGESGAPQDRLFSWIGSLFRLRNCTKYYWKGLALDETNQFVEATTDNQQQEKHDLLLSGDEVDEISSSPVAVVARSLWIDLQDTYFPLWSNQDLKGISDFLINTMDHILSVEVKLFSPEHAVEQLISATFLQTASKEFSPTDDQIEKIFGSEDLWVKARNQANLIQFLDSTRFADINFDSTLISSSSSSSSGQSGPPKFAFFRLLRLAVALLEKVNPAFLFHLDGRRDWMLAEMLLGAIVIQNASLHPFGEDPVQDELTLAREELFETTEEQEKTGIDLILDSMISSSSVPSGEDEDKQKNDQEGSGKRRAASVITILNERIRSGSFSRETEYLFAIELGFLLEKLSSGQSSASAELLLTHFSSFIIPGFPAPSEPVPVLLQEAVLPPLFSALQLSRDLQELQIPSLMQRVLAVATNLTDASQSDESKTLALRLISHLLQIEPLQNEEQGYLVYLLMTQLADCAKTPFVQEETLQIALCKIMKSCVRHPFGAAMFEPELWVFVTEQCGAWLQGSPRSAVFFQALKLLRSLEGLEPVRSSAETQLVQCNKHLFDQLFSLTLSSPPVPLGATDSAMLAELAKVVSLNFKTSRLGQYFASLPQALANLFQMVECPHSQVQLTAARVLILILQHLSETKQDVEAIPLLGKSTKSISKLPAVAVPLVSMITQGAGLSKSKSGRSAASKTLTIEEEPHLDYFFRHNLKSEFTFFLIWSIYLSWHRDQETKIKHTCCSLLKQDGVLFRYFDRLFGRLRELEVTEQPTGTFVDQLPFVDVKDEQSLRSFYNEIVLLTAFTLPGAFRSWSSETDKSLSQFVEGYMTTLIFPSVLRTEIEQINNYKSDNPNFWIKTRSNEIQANFKEDDTTITLKLKIPKTYPLQPVKLSSDNRKGIDENEWRKWTFSMTSLLMTSESNILDALMIWKNTVTKKFEDIEPCLICYSVFHISDNSLPKLACKTCRNKFHSGCLYRWFDTSHKSNCPLCQTPWMSD